MFFLRLESALELLNYVYFIPSIFEQKVLGILRRLMAKLEFLKIFLGNRV